MAVSIGLGCISKVKIVVFQRTGHRETGEMMPGLGLELRGEVQLLRATPADGKRSSQAYEALEP